MDAITAPKARRRPSVTVTLLAKEMRQHRSALLALTGLLAVAFGLALLMFRQQARTLSVLELVSRFALAPLTAAALYLGHRLVVGEYYGRTQRFVEALPVQRGHMVLVKAGFGLGWMLLWALGALAAGVALAEGERIDARFLAILTARLVGHLWALWGLVFLLGFFGRLRVLLAIVVVLTVFLVDRHTAWQMDQFGPLALIDGETFPFERHRLPITALVQSVLLGALALAAAWGLSRVREGSVVEALARPLSARELSALLLVGAAGGLAFSALDREKDPEPYAFTTDKVLRRAPVEIAYLADELRPVAERLLAELHPTVETLARELALPAPLPAIRLVHAPEVPADRPRSVMTHWTQGTVLRVNLSALPDGPQGTVIAHVLHQVVWARTRGRAGVEARHWVLDGYTLHLAWQRPLGGAAPPALDGPGEIWRRALVASELHPLRMESLRDYYVTAERLGEDLSLALAASGWHLLQERVGRERSLALARAALSRPGTGDVRDFLHERRHPLATLFERTTGLGYPQFFELWRAELARLRRKPEAEALLQALPGGRWQVLADSRSGITVAGKAARAPDSDRVCRLQHLKLAPYEMPFDPDGLEEDSFVWSAGDGDLARVVPAEYGWGERAFVALDCELPGIGCPVRLVAARVTVP